MATFVTLTVPVEDILGTDYDERRTAVYIEANTPNSVIIVDSDEIRIGGRRENPVSGVATFTNLVATNSADNPTSFEYRVTIVYTPKGSRTGQQTLTTSTFPLTTSANLAAIPEAWDDITAPPSWRSTFRDEMEDILAGAQAIAGPVDATVAGLAKNSGGIGPLTQAALVETYGNAVPVTRYGAKGDAYILADSTGWGGTDDTAAIQAADDAAAAVAAATVTGQARKGPVALWFPAGNYKLTGTVNKSPRTVWIGPGVRFINSATSAKNSQGASLVVCHDGAGVKIAGQTTWTGAGMAQPTINHQRGKIEGIQILAGDIYAPSGPTYPNAKAIHITDWASEQFFEDILINGFKYGVHVQGAMSARFDEVYNTNCTDTGLRCENGHEFFFKSCQWAGANYGARFMDKSGNMHGIDNRWQVSGLAALFIDTCDGMFNFQGGLADTSVGVGAGTRYGVYVKDTSNVVVQGCQMYANGDVHVFVEATATGTTAGVQIDGFFHPGQSASTLYAFKVTKDAAGSMNDIVLGGLVRFGMGPLDPASNFVPTLLSYTGTGLAMWKELKSIGDINRYAAMADTQPRTKVTTAAIQFGAGGTTAPTAQIGYIGADIVGVPAGDSFQITDGTWNGGRFRMGAYHLWVDSSGRLRIKSGAPASDTDGTVVGTQA